MQARLDCILQAADNPLKLKDVIATIAQDESHPVDCAAIHDFLLESPYAVEVEKDCWFNPSRLIDERMFFAIPERADVQAGRICFVGSDIYLLMRLAAERGKAEFVAEDGTVIPVGVRSEDMGYFYASGLESWYKQTKFRPEHDSVLLMVLDYRACRYAFRRLLETELDRFVSHGTRVRACNWLMSFLSRETVRLPEAEEGGFSVGGALCFLLHHKPALFASYPCNLSFYMSLDERFFVTGKQFFLRDEAESVNFTEHYIGDDNAMLLETRDGGKFNRALEALYGGADAEQAKKLFRQLLRDYPEEQLLHKYIYQAAWYLEDYETVRRHAKLYHSAFGRDPDALCTLAEVSILYGEYDKAEEYLMTAEKLVHPEDTRTKADICSARMRGYWERGAYLASVLEAKHLLTLEPDNEDALMLLRDFPELARRANRGRGGRANIIKADFTNRRLEMGEKDDSRI